MHEDYLFVDFWIQGEKTTKSSLMGLVLMTSGAKTRKSWHNITSKNVLLSDHCSLGHLFVGPLLLLTEPAEDPRNQLVAFCGCKCLRYDSQDTAHRLKVLPKVEAWLWNHTW